MASASSEVVFEIQGQKVGFPVVVRDAASASVIYTAPADQVAKLVPGDAFELVELEGGLAQVIIVLVDYRDNDLGDYNEVGIIFFVKPRGAPTEEAGTFIYQLPVDQSFTCEAGCRIWGFPKTVQQIDMEYSGEFVTGRLSMDGRHVFTLRVPTPEPSPGAEDAPGAEGDPSYNYTYIEGVPHRTVQRTGGGASAVTPGGTGVELELGDHPLADELRALGLAEAAPLVATWMPHMSGSFDAAQKLKR